MGVSVVQTGRWDSQMFESPANRCGWPSLSSRAYRVSRQMVGNQAGRRLQMGRAQAHACAQLHSNKGWDGEIRERRRAGKTCGYRV